MRLREIVCYHILHSRIVLRTVLYKQHGVLFVKISNVHVDECIWTALGANDPDSMVILAKNAKIIGNFSPDQSQLPHKNQIHEFIFASWSCQNTKPHGNLCLVVERLAVVRLSYRYSLTVLLRDTRDYGQGNEIWRSSRSRKQNKKEVFSLQLGLAGHKSFVKKWVCLCPMRRSVQHVCMICVGTSKPWQGGHYGRNRKWTLRNNQYIYTERIERMKIISSKTSNGVNNSSYPSR